MQMATAAAAAAVASAALASGGMAAAVGGSGDLDHSNSGSSPYDIYGDDVSPGTNRRRFVCETCGKSYQRPEHLSRHKVSVESFCFSHYAIS